MKKESYTTSPTDEKASALGKQPAPGNKKLKLAKALRDNLLRRKQAVTAESKP